MNYDWINEDFLLLLVKTDKNLELRKLTIDRNFENDRVQMSKLCSGNHDNFQEITRFINQTLRLKLPDKTYNYCKILDKPYQSVRINFFQEIEYINLRVNLIYQNQKNAEEKKEQYSIEEKIVEFKREIASKIEDWFKAFDIDAAYNKAKSIKSVLVYSHRISGWSRPEYEITNNLKQEVKTNFGYGQASYFYSLLTFKNIQITPLSEWIDYQHANFSEIIRYTRRFHRKIPIESQYQQYHKMKIENSDWHNALTFTREAANLLLENENEFVEKYIIDECERMVKGLTDIYSSSTFKFINETNSDSMRTKVDMKGFELIDFKAEKIIGALDFIDKVIEYSSIIDCKKYLDRIYEINRKFIPNVHNAIKDLEHQLKNAQLDFLPIKDLYTSYLNKKDFYKTQIEKLKDNFQTEHPEYSNFCDYFEESKDKFQKKKKLIEDLEMNIDKMNDFKDKFNKYVL